MGCPDLRRNKLPFLPSLAVSHPWDAHLKIDRFSSSPFETHAFEALDVVF